MMLANASHELRTPLSRIRLGLDLMEQRPDAGLKAELQSDIAELDRLIDEILLASRLDASPTLSAVEDVDLQALCAEECARFEECELTGERAVVTGRSASPPPARPQSPGERRSPRPSADQGFPAKRRRPCP